MKKKGISRTVVNKYALYEIVLERFGDRERLYLEVEATYLGLNFRINISDFWHDISEWKTHYGNK